MIRKSAGMLVRIRRVGGISWRQFSSSCLRCSEMRRPVRVRFAPSPTGHLHLGGFRTALLNYLFAMKHDGKFILRIEDTDQTRLVPDALQMIQNDLSWLGIEPHESPLNPGQYGPYIQSQRLALYQEHLQDIIDSGHAYECFCSEKRLELVRKEAVRQRQKPRYDNKCRDLTRDEVQRKKAAGEQYCVRFKLKPENVTFKDLVYGDVGYDLTGMNYEGDPVIVKSDGFPTYHFANVVDDHCMEITHVLRGVEWQISTPKHLQMYKALNWDPPDYAHLPLVLNKDGTKLSKRQGDISITHYRNQTYYPIALANFVTKSGGGFSYHEVDKLWSLPELTQTFDIGNVNTGGCRLDFALLEKLNQLELKTQIVKNLISASNTLVENLSANGIRVEDFPSSYVDKLLRWCPERVSKIKDLASKDFDYLWSQPKPELLSKVSTSPQILQLFIDMCKENLSEKPGGSVDTKKVSTLLEEFGKSHKLNHKTFLRDLRIMLCGITKGPPIVEVFHLFGKEMVCSRLMGSIEYLNKLSQNSSRMLQES